MFFAISIRFIATVLVFGCLSLGVAQESQLVFLKVNNASSASFFDKQQTNFSQTFSLSNLDDVSILPTENPTSLSPNLSDGSSFLIYNDSLDFLGNFELDDNSAPILYPLKSTETTAYYFRSTYGVLQNQNFSETFPQLSGGVQTSVPAEVVAAFAFNWEENALSVPFYCNCPDYDESAASNHSPFSSFKLEIGVLNINANNKTMNAVWLEDGTIFTNIPIFNSLSINGIDDYFLGENDLWGSYWVKFDPVTTEYTAVPLFSQFGSTLIYGASGSEGGESIFRSGVSWGFNAPISPDGTTLSLSENDSLYHAFIVKESTEGEMIWLDSLFSYGKSQSDMSVTLNRFRVNGVQELNGHSYLSIFYQVNGQEASDTILFKNFIDEPVFLSSGDFLPGTFGFVAKSSREIIQYDEDGTKLKKLIYPIRSKDPWSELNAGWFFQQPELFKVNNALGWPQTYSSTNDTTLYFIEQLQDGSLDSTGIDLPAGRGTFVLWLDENLNIIDFTNFPFSTGGNNLVPGVSLSAISIFQDDTLMISGSIGAGTTTSLDPEGLAEEITYSEGKNFIAFYSVPELLLSEDHINQLESKLKVYPNPARDYISIKSNLPTPASYNIYDITGRKIKNGNVLSAELNTISISDLSSGIFILEIRRDQDIIATEKFVVK